MPGDGPEETGGFDDERLEALGQEEQELKEDLRVYLATLAELETLALEANQPVRAAEVAQVIGSFEGQRVEGFSFFLESGEALPNDVLQAQILEQVEAYMARLRSFVGVVKAGLRMLYPPPPARS